MFIIIFTDCLKFLKNTTITIQQSKIPLYNSKTEINKSVILKILKHIAILSIKDYGILTGSSLYFVRKTSVCVTTGKIFIQSKGKSIKLTSIPKDCYRKNYMCKKTNIGENPQLTKIISIWKYL